MITGMFVGVNVNLRCEIVRLSYFFLINKTNIKLLEWLSQNPDLHPFGNLWTTLKSRVCARLYHWIVEGSKRV